MRGLIKFAVLLAIAGGLTWYYLGERKAEREHERVEQIAKRLFPHGDERDTDALSDAIAEIRVTPSGSTEEITVVRESDDIWRITTPRDLSADNTIVNSLARTLAGLELAGSPDEMVIRDVAPENLAHFGIDDTSLRVAVRHTGETAPVRLLVGDQDPAEANRYALIEGTRDVLVIQDRHTALNRDLFTLRDKSILSVTPDTALSVAVATSAEDIIRIARDTPADDWRLEAPVADEADRGQVSTLINHLRNLRAQEFLAEDATDADIADHALASPEFLITVVAAEETHCLRVAPARLGSRPVMREGTAVIAAVPTAPIDSVIEDPARLRSRQVCAINPDDVQRIIYHTDGHAATLTRDDTAEPFADLTSALRSLQARGVMSDGETRDLAAL